MGKTRLLAVALMLSPLLALAAESPDPQMKTIIDNAIQRDKLFDRVDAKVSFTYIQGGGKAVYSYDHASGRWVKDGAKVLADYVYKDMDGKTSTRYANAFDGKVTKGINYTRRSGEISPDAVSSDRDRGGEVHLARGSLGIRLGGERVCDLLQGIVSPAAASRSRQPLTYRVSFAGNEPLDGKDCAVVDVFRETGDASPGKWRLHLAKDFGYAPAKMDFYASSDAKTPVSTVALSGFKQAPQGAWYATEGRMDESMGSKARSVLKIEKITFPSSIDPALFTLKFPAGTHVYDSVANADYVVGGARPSGSLSPMPDDARFLSILAVTLPSVALIRLVLLVARRFRQSRPNS